jgi:hypothetical protein
MDLFGAIRPDFYQKLQEVDGSKPPTSKIRGV